MKRILTLPLLIAVSLVAACSSHPSRESTYRFDETENTVDVKLLSENMSGIHSPPFSSALGYIKVYDKSERCGKRITLIGKVYNNLADPTAAIYISPKERTKTGKLPEGQVLAKIGFSHNGIGASSSCSRHYQFTTQKNHSYEVVINESRPFVTGCTIAIKEIGPDGDYNSSVKDLKSSVDGGFLNMDDDIGPLCEDIDAEKTPPES